MSTKKDDHIPEEHYVSKAWLKNYRSTHLPENDILHIIDPFPSIPSSTAADPKLSPPPMTFDTLKKAIALIEEKLIVRFEVNQELFNEIATHIPTAKPPRFKLINPYSILYKPYDSIPIILIPDQVEPLKIIRKKEVV